MAPQGNALKKRDMLLEIQEFDHDATGVVVEQREIICWQGEGRAAAGRSANG
jgi:hypothetical protein